MKTVFRIVLVLWIAAVAFVVVPVGVLMPEYRQLIGAAVFWAAVLWAVWGLTAYSIRGPR